MHVTWSPEDGETQTWEFNPGRVRQSEAEMIERRAGCRWDEWVVLVKAEQATALKVLLWHLLRRAHSHLRFEDVPDFFMDELTVQLDLGELLETRAELEKRGDVFGPDLVRYLSEVDREIEDRKTRGEVAPGKARSKRGASPTPTPSPTD